MEPGLLVELSSTEEVALRRAARGLAESSVTAANLERLKLLSLIVSKDRIILLTELGKARVAAFSRHQPYIDPNSGEFTAALAKALGVKNIE
jgi:hypothetical protein